MRVQFSAVIALFNLVNTEGHTRNLRNAHRNLKKNTQSEACTIEAVAALLIEPESTGTTSDITFVCVLDSADTGAPGLTRRIDTTPGQKAALEALLESGVLVSGESTLYHGRGASFDNESLFFPPGQDIAASVSNKGGNRRRLAITKGVKPILVVKVYDVNGLAHPRTPAQISDDVFGTDGDPNNLKSQLSDCSWGQLEVVPGTISDASIKAAEGVIEVNIGISLTNQSGGNIRNAVTTAAQAKLGFGLPGPYQQVMYVLQGCYVDCGWAAYAYVNSWNSVYQGDYYYMTGVQVHELGHNFNLAHSGGLSGQTYTDHTGMMGNPLYSDDTGKMCFNAAKNWQLDWYTDTPGIDDTGSKLLIDPTSPSFQSQEVVLVGVGEYNTRAGQPVTVKIETGASTDIFIGFNRATGPNAQNDEADNGVTVTESGNNGGGYSQSYLKATLGCPIATNSCNTALNVAYTVANFAGTGKTLSITATAIDITTTPGTATVCVALDGATCAQVPTGSPTQRPTMPPVTPAPTAPTGSPTKNPTMPPVTPVPTPPPTPNPTDPPCTGLGAGVSCDHRGNCREASANCCTECCNGDDGAGNSRSCL